jgi:preprotein translocase subunit YajC
MASSSTTNSTSGNSSYVILMVVLIAVMYFMMIRPQKKRQKEEQEMRSSLEIGDEIITIGGIVGKVVTIREQDIVIETGADRTKMKIQRWAVNTNVTKTEQHQKEVEAARDAAKDKKKKKADKKAEISDTAKQAEEKIEK